MSVWEHSRFRVFNASQHPYKHSLSDFLYANNRLPPGVVNVQGVMDYIVAVLYPKYIGTYANAAALPVTATPNDYAIVSDDGAGFAAGYVWTVIDGVSQWMKRYDMQWSVDSILSETVNKTQYMYVQKYGMSDKDASGNALTGINAGQHIYGGDVASENLTLHANAGNTLGGHSGYIQHDDDTRPTIDNSFLLGTASFRWKNGYFVDLNTGTFETTGAVTIGGNTAITGNLTTTGTVNGFNVSGTNTGDVTLAALDSQAGNSTGAALITGQILSMQSASATVPGLVNNTNQSFGGLKTFTNGIAGTTVAFTGNATIGGTLGVTGAITGSNLSGTNSGDVTLGAIGSAPNADGASLAAQVLTLQPANASFGGVVTAGAQTFAGAKTFASIISTGNATFSSNLVLTTAENFQLGANNFLTDSFMALRNLMFRDAAHTQPVQANDGLYYDSVSGTWLAASPDTEVVHNLISGLTTGDAGHTQFVMLAGRTGGQSIYGDTASSGNLTLNSTFHATKGSILFADPLTPAVTATYSAGWSGTNLGSASKLINNVYTAGQFIGLRLENNGAAVSSGQNPGRLVYVGSDICAVDNGSAFVNFVMCTQAQSIAGVKTFTGNTVHSAQVVIGATTPGTSLDVNGDFATRQTTQASGGTLIAMATTTSLVKLTGSSATTIQGMAGGANGKWLVLFNGSSAAATIQNQNAGASAANRIITSSGLDTTLAANGVMLFFYDSVQSLWIQGGGGGSGGGALVVTGTRASPSAITAAGGVTVVGANQRSLIRIKGSGGPVTITASPQLTAGSIDGAECILEGSDDVNTVTLVNGLGNEQNGNVTLGIGDKICYIWNAGASVWSEAWRIPSA
jgi:hypothetical protein